jgi:hypothetical protein
MILTCNVVGGTGTGIMVGADVWPGVEGGGNRVRPVWRVRLGQIWNVLVRIFGCERGATLI